MMVGADPADTHCSLFSTKIFRCTILILLLHLISSTPVIKKKPNHASGRSFEPAMRSGHFLLTELSVSDEDKHCYACSEADDQCLTPCHWTQRCFMKARHANGTGQFDRQIIPFIRVLTVCSVVDRQCTTERWTRELLVDGCLTYMKNYLCMCSSDMCNGGDLDSIRGERAME